MFFVTRSGRGFIRHATCLCAQGAYESQFRERRDAQRPRGPYETFTLDDARRLDLLDPSAHTRHEHWLHAHNREKTVDNSAQSLRTP